MEKILLPPLIQCMLKYQKISVCHLFYQMLFITYNSLNISKYINLGKCSRGVRLHGICTILAVRTLLHKELGTAH